MTSPVVSAISPWATSGQITAPEARSTMGASWAKGIGSTTVAEGGVVEGAEPTASIVGGSVRVTAHNAVVPSANGTFIGVSEASMDLLLQTPFPSAGQSRIDLVVGGIGGTADTSAVYQLERVTGTASGSPSAPAVPANKIPLFQVTVNNSGLQTVTATYGRTRAPGGIRLVNAGDTRAGSYTGDLRKFITGQIDVWTGAAWNTIVQPSAWTQFTPSLTSAIGGALNMGSTGSAIGRYMVQGKLCHLRYIFRGSGAGYAGGRGAISTTLPPGITSAPSEETQILAKLNAFGFASGSLYAIFMGVCFIPPSSNQMTLWMPQSIERNDLGVYQSADSTGNPGTGRPNIPGDHPVFNPLVIQGTIEIS